MSFINALALNKGIRGGSRPEKIWDLLDTKISIISASFTLKRSKISRILGELGDSQPYHRCRFFCCLLRGAGGTGAPDAAHPSVSLLTHLWAPPISSSLGASAAGFTSSCAIVNQLVHIQDYADIAAGLLGLHRRSQSGKKKLKPHDSAKCPC